MIDTPKSAGKHSCYAAVSTKMTRHGLNTLALIGYTLLVLSAVHLAFAILLLRRARRGGPLQYCAAMTAILSAVYCVAAGLTYVRASCGLDWTLTYRACWIGWLIMAPGMQIAYYVQGRVRAARIAGWILYPQWIVILILCLTTDFVEIGAQSLLPFVDSVGPLEVPARLVASAILLWGIYQSFRASRVTVGIRRQQSGYLLLAMVCFALGGAITSSLFPALGMPLDPALTSFFTVLWVAITFYAVTRYRLFDIRIVLSQTLAAAALMGLVAAFHIGIFVLFQRWVTPNTAILIATLATVLIVFATPLVAVVRRVARRLVIAERYDYQRLLREAALALISILSLEDLLRRLMDLVRRSLGVSNAALFMRGEGGAHTMRYALGLPEGAAITLPAAGLVSWLTEQHKAFVREEQERELQPELFAPLQRELEPIKGEIAIPIVYQGSLSGVLVLGHKGNRDAFLQSDIDLLETFASQAAVAIENARLFQEAVTDGLTGLYHQKHFKTRLKEELERARRHHHRLVLLMVDIDHFKVINDTHGHLVGDSVLRDLAKVTRACFREGDLVARYGGEEFAILLAETDPRFGNVAAERLRQQVEAMPCDHDLHVTVSVGVSVYDGTDLAESEITLIDRADTALYKAKQLGRNRVELADEVPQSIEPPQS
jgi:diguanylate cyclase (GGDEF)-like protein